MRTWSQALWTLRGEVLLGDGKFSTSLTEVGKQLCEGCPNEARLSQYKILGKNKGGEINDQVISLMEGDRASLDSLTMPLQIRPSHKRA